MSGMRTITDIVLSLERLTSPTALLSSGMDCMTHLSDMSGAQLGTLRQGGNISAGIVTAGSTVPKKPSAGWRFKVWHGRVVWWSSDVWDMEQQTLTRTVL